MKIIAKLVLNIFIFFSIYLISDYLIQYISIENEFIASSVMLFKYGGATGYFVFIIFIALLQFEGFKHVGRYKPKLSSLMRIFYLIIALIFLISGILKFDMLFIIFMAVIFMMITSTLDIVKEKIIHQHEGNKLFPKKTM
jgi:hypothetical protein